MAKINLRDFYPFYNTDLFIEIPDEVNAVLLEAERLERNYILTIHWTLATELKMIFCLCRSLPANSTSAK